MAMDMNRVTISMKGVTKTDTVYQDEQSGILKWFAATFYVDILDSQVECLG